MRESRSSDYFTLARRCLEGAIPDQTALLALLEPAPAAPANNPSARSNHRGFKWSRPSRLNLIRYVITRPRKCRGPFCFICWRGRRLKSREELANGPKCWPGRRPKQPAHREHKISYPAKSDQISDQPPLRCTLLWGGLPAQITEDEAATSQQHEGSREKTRRVKQRRQIELRPEETRQCDSGE